ncbi:putative alpha-glucosidase [Microsporum canis]|uniref:Alpha-glucosidase n=1 Tax=Arthroderma otae (strain ATCC MYA-4605 / CBS 113480) TaxID=554155 RepID=C5FBM0_ARTOC|nr:alpha-glucosidase [Microsporum canis CBS 113480]EEQ27204.1 alpha-glucosidase [Microsporum canis CBS 113480]
MFGRTLVLAAVIATTALSASLEKCPGYKVSNIRDNGHTLEADLRLAGEACNVYGEDLRQLKLRVEYQTTSRLHVIIEDSKEDVYQVPESVFPRPGFEESAGASKKSMLKFTFTKEPFSFKVTRRATGEVIFDTAGSALIFESQYLRLRTSLPVEPNLYGLGEHSDPLRLKTDGLVTTLWNRDAYGIPPGTNLYGSHPVYYDHRGKSGTHGVFLLNSNGMDIKVGSDENSSGSKYLEYNTLGGVLDFYFMAGPTPKDVASQYAEVVGLPAMMPYWGFGFHQCRYGYQDAFNVAEVVYNYSQADIPLETMWTDIDYMDGRKVFTLDSERFPIGEMRALVDYLHDHDQHYVVMVDPAVSYGDNDAFYRGKEQGIFMKTSNGSIYKGAVWPGVTAFPDWFHPGVQDYWNNEFKLFFDPEKGIDIDALWIDMNEAANFCDWPCSDPERWERDHDLPPAPPPVRPIPRPLPGFPGELQPKSVKTAKRDEIKVPNKAGLPGRDLIDPPYRINNEAGSINNKTMDTNLVHSNGLVEYDTHNLYGTMMSSISRESLLSRRPTKRPMVITRSTFAGAGAHVGHWLGDNLSEWSQYRFSISQILQFAAIYQIPMVGADVCGFGGNTTEELCARWAMLGAFYPFYRNHNDIAGQDQEFYRWGSVAKAARTAIEIRYKLLDYIYTAFHRQTQSGDPILNPLFYIYPEDKNTFAIDLQFFYGDALLVSPVTEKGATSVDIYLPDDLFYDFYTGAPVEGKGEMITMKDIPTTHIPLHFRGGNIVPMRSNSAITTTKLRKEPFDLVICLDRDGNAEGSLYIDDGDSLDQTRTTEINFEYRKGTLRISGKFDFQPEKAWEVKNIFVLGHKRDMSGQRKGDENKDLQYNKKLKKLAVKVGIPLTGPSEMTFY